MMIQAVQQYQDAVAAAEAAYTTAANTRQAAVEGAWTALGEADHPFVRFAVQNAGSYKREVVAILGALPESPNAADVRRAAEELGFSGSEVTAAIDAAVEQGVLEDSARGAITQDSVAPQEQAGSARRRFLDRVRAALGNQAVNEAATALDEIIAEETGAAADSTGHRCSH